MGQSKSLFCFFLFFSNVHNFFLFPILNSFEKTQKKEIITQSLYLFSREPTISLDRYIELISVANDYNIDVQALKMQFVPQNCSKSTSTNRQI